MKTKLDRSSECTAHGTIELAGIDVDRALRVGHVASATTVGFARGLNDTPKILGLMIGASVIDPTAGTERVEVGELTCAAGEQLGLGRLIFVVADGARIDATPLLPAGAGFASASAPVGRGVIRYATPETEEETPIAWPVLGEVEVRRGEHATFTTPAAAGD